MVEELGEDCRRIELREAHEVNRGVHPNERDRAEIANDAIILNRVVLASRAAPSPFHHARPYLTKRRVPKGCCIHSLEKPSRNLARNMPRYVRCRVVRRFVGLRKSRFFRPPFSFFCRSVTVLAKPTKPFIQTAFKMAGKTGVGPRLTWPIQVQSRPGQNRSVFLQ